MPARTFTVDTSLPEYIAVNAKGLAGLAQEIRTVMSTPRGSVPLDRDFGIDFSVIDAPVNAALPRYVADVSMAIEKYVPRVQVVSVRFAPPQNEAVDGVLRPKATVRIRDEYLSDFLPAATQQGVP